MKKVVLWGVPIMTVMERGDFLREEPPDYHNEFLGTVMSFVSDRFPDDDHPWQLKVRATLSLPSCHSCDRKRALYGTSRCILHSLLRHSFFLCEAGRLAGWYGNWGRRQWNEYRDGLIAVY